MPKHLLRRYLPEPERIIQRRSLRFLGKRLNDPSLWHLNHRSAAGAMFWGLFCAMMPMPFQLLLATASALFFRLNLALTLALVWSSNPITLIPLVWLAYRIGSLLLGLPMLTSAELESVLDDAATVLGHLFSSGNDAAWTRLIGYAQPFLLGSFCMGLGFGSLGYVLMRLYWRWHVVRAWRQRQARRQASAETRHD